MTTPQHDTRTDTPDTRTDSETRPAGDPAAAGQVLLVRRRRVPALGFWVTLVVVLAALLGMVIAWFADVRDLGGMLYFAATAVVFIGGPAALIAAVVDAVLHRRPRPGRTEDRRPPVA